MKKLLISFLFISLLSFKMADVFSDLGITKPQMQELITNNLTNGYLSYPGSVRKVALGSRASIVQSVGIFVKSYVETEDFKNRYAEWWKNQEPTKPDSPEQKTAERKQQVEDQKKEQVKALAEIRNQIATTKDQNMKKQLEQFLAIQIQAEAQINSPEYQKQMQETYEMMAKIEVEEYKSQIAEYQEKYKVWQEQKDPKVLIKLDLRKFLDATEGVDFEAKLKTDQYGKKVFINEEYEGKDANWKTAFRAGKPATEAARNFAQEWLKNL
jgi:hypothetical protein